MKVDTSNHEEVWVSMRSWSFCARSLDDRPRTRARSSSGFLARLSVDLDSTPELDARGLRMGEALLVPGDKVRSGDDAAACIAVATAAEEEDADMRDFFRWFLW